MTHIAHLIKTSSLVRIFLVVVLSLGMAWLIGSGLRMRNNNLSTDFDQSAPAVRSSTGTLVTTDTSAASQTSTTSTNATALDKAVRLLGGVDRTRNSTGGSNLAKTTNNQAVAANQTDANSAANPGTTNKVNNVASDPNQKSATNVQTAPGK